MIRLISALGVKPLVPHGEELVSILVTYYGLGGPIPASYELVANECFGGDRLRTWVQGSRRQSSSAWLETVDSVMSVSRSDMHCALASLIRGEPSWAP